MNNYLYNKLKHALKEESIESLENLYHENSDNLIIKFQYAKRLKHINLELSKKLLKELIGTSNENYALIELGIIEKEQKNYTYSRKYFNTILESTTANEDDRNYAKLELGRLEIKLNNITEASSIFNELTTSSIWYYACLELGKLELKNGNKEIACKYFEKVLNSKCWYHAKLWLGKIELFNNRYLQALIYFNELLKSPVRKEAIKEINKIRQIQSNEHKKTK